MLALVRERNKNSPSNVALLSTLYHYLIPTVSPDLLSRSTVTHIQHLGWKWFPKQAA